MPDIKPPDRIQEFPLAVLKNMVTLTTSGFGVVVALAWNQVIQDVVKKYIDPYLGKDGGMLSLLIYAIFMTILAVLVTMQLSAVQKRVERTMHRDEPEFIDDTPPQKSKKKK
jgi:hypothetical protein